MMNTSTTDALDVLEVWTVVGGSVGLFLAVLWVVHHIYVSGCFGRRRPAAERKVSLVEDSLHSIPREAPTYSTAFQNVTPRVSSIY